MYRRNIKKMFSIILCAAMCMGNLPAHASGSMAASENLTASTGVTTEAAAEEAEPVEEQDTEQAEEEQAEDGYSTDKETDDPFDYSAYGYSAADESEEYEDEQAESTEDAEDIQEEAPEETKTGTVTFIDRATGDPIPYEMILFDRPAEYTGTGFIFNGASVGDVVHYRITGEDYATVEDEFTIGSYDFTVDTDLIVKAEIGEEGLVINRTYGDNAFVLSDYINIPDDYSGKITYQVTDGQETVNVDDKGVVSILSAGDAQIGISFAGDKAYKASEMSVSVTAGKRNLGTISAADVVWDNLSVPYRKDRTYTVTGSISGIMNDVIGVSAVVVANEAAVGTRQTSIYSAEFTGAENYEISMSGDGPDITITGRAGLLPASENADPGEGGQDQGGEGDDIPSDETETETKISVSYEDESEPVNGKYFNTGRKMTISVTAAEYTEDLLSVTIGKDGTDYTLSDIRNGVDGIKLSSEDITAETESAEYVFEIGKDENTESEYTVSAVYDGMEAQYIGEAATDFAIDNVAPVIEMSYTDANGNALAPGKDPESKVYSREGVLAKITVKEKNFTEDGMDIRMSAKNAKDQDAGVSAEGNWTDEGSVHTYDMDALTEDANYAISAGCTDMAGNKAETEGTDFFTVDTTAPTGTVKVKTSDGQVKEYERVLTEKEQKDGIIKYIFGIFSRTVTLSSEADDETSGVESIQYYLIDVDSKAKASFEQKADLGSLEWKDYKENIVINTDRIAVILEKITDKAGNVTYLSSEGGLIVDTKDPGIPVVVINGPKTDLYNKDVTFDVVAVDPDNGSAGAYSGIKKLTYTLRTSKDENPVKLGEKTAEGPRTGTMSDKVKIKADKDSNKNGLIFTVKAEDYAGNTKEEKVVFSIDTTAPVIETDLDDADIRNERYFNASKDMKVTFRERNFDSANTTMSLHCEGEDLEYSIEDLTDGKAEEYGITAKKSGDTQKDKKAEEYTDEREVTYVITFGDLPNADIDYEKISFASEDRAGNKTEKKYDDHEIITIDKVAPVLAVSFYRGSEDITSMIGRNMDVPYFSNEGIRVRMSVTERNFSADTFETGLSQTDAYGNEVQAYSEDISGFTRTGGNWSGDSDVHTINLPAFTADANYGIDAAYTDLAGNQAQGYDIHYFTVDRTAPKGSVEVDSSDGSESYSSYSNQAVFRFISSRAILISREAEDKTSGIADIGYYRYTPPADARGVFDGLSLDELRSVSWNSWNSGGTLAVDPDSQAVIYARITDRAGNILYISTEGAMIAEL